MLSSAKKTHRWDPTEVEKLMMPHLTKEKPEPQSTELTDRKTASRLQRPHQPEGVYLQ